MAVMTIAICDEIRKDAQKLSRQLSTLVPDAEILVYRSRQGLLDGLSQEHKICNMVFMGLDGENGKKPGDCAGNETAGELYTGCHDSGQ